MKTEILILSLLALMGAHAAEQPPVSPQNQTPGIPPPRPPDNPNQVPGVPPALPTPNPGVPITPPAPLPPLPPTNTIGGVIVVPQFVPEPELPAPVLPRPQPRARQLPILAGPLPVPTNTLPNPPTNAVLATPTNTVPYPLTNALPPYPVLPPK